MQINLRSTFAAEPGLTGTKTGVMVPCSVEYADGVAVALNVGLPCEYRASASGSGHPIETT